MQLFSSFFIIHNCTRSGDHALTKPDSSITSFPIKMPVRHMLGCKSHTHRKSRYFEHHKAHSQKNKCSSSVERGRTLCNITCIVKALAKLIIWDSLIIT